jgi:hypothetical protein
VKDFQSKGKKPKEIKIKDDAKQERVRDEIKRGASGWGKPVRTRKPEQYGSQYDSAIHNLFRNARKYFKRRV